MSNFFTTRLAGLDIGVESRCASVRRQRELSEEPVTEEYAEALALYGADGNERLGGVNIEN